MTVQCLPTKLVTFTRRTVDLMCPHPSDIDVRDIAHALSLTNRFGGHTCEPYSVAAHSCHVAQLIHPRWALHALLHDAAEAYLGDIVTPLKHLVSGFADCEMGFDDAIASRFGITWGAESFLAVKRADNLALRTELQAFFPWMHSEATPDPSNTYQSDDVAFAETSGMRFRLSPIAAEAWFLHAFNKLTGDERSLLECES
jgi:uncharacterized protein